MTDKYGAIILLLGITLIQRSAKRLSVPHSKTWQTNWLAWEIFSTYECNPLPTFEPKIQPTTINFWKKAGLIQHWSCWKKYDLAVQHQSFCSESNKSIPVDVIPKISRSSCSIEYRSAQNNKPSAIFRFNISKSFNQTRKSRRFFEATSLSEIETYFFDT